MHKILVNYDNFSHLIVNKLNNNTWQEAGYFLLNHTSMKEETIAKFKYKNSTYKLLKITTNLQCIYYITKNRKRLAHSLWKDNIIKKFASLITTELLQTEITIDKNNTTKEEQINKNDIRVSKPKTDCKYCNIRNFLNSEDKYAMCKCPKICKGLTEVTIQNKTKPLEFIFSCKNCKYYEKIC